MKERKKERNKERERLIYRGRKRKKIRNTMILSEYVIQTNEREKERGFPGFPRKVSGFRE
jgi:hypothetical protein